MNILKFEFDPNAVSRQMCKIFMLLLVMAFVILPTLALSAENSYTGPCIECNEWSYDLEIDFQKCASSDQCSCATFDFERGSAPGGGYSPAHDVYGILFKVCDCEQVENLSLLGSYAIRVTIMEPSSGVYFTNRNYANSNSNHNCCLNSGGNQTSWNDGSCNIYVSSHPEKHPCYGACDESIQSDYALPYHSETSGQELYDPESDSHNCCFTCSNNMVKCVKTEYAKIFRANYPILLIDIPEFVFDPYDINIVDGTEVIVKIEILGASGETICECFNKVGQFSDKVVAPLEIFEPSSGATLSTFYTTFKWRGGGSDYQLKVGTFEGGADIYNSCNLGTKTYHTVYNLPTTGQTIYVTLSSYIDHRLYSNRYTYSSVCTTRRDKRYLGYIYGNVSSTLIPYEELTHICNAFGEPDYNGNLTTPDANPELIHDAHENCVKVLLSIGGASDETNQLNDKFKTIVADSDLRENFIESIYDTCVNDGYDGVDIDWESPEDENQKDGLNLLIKEISERFQHCETPLEITMAIPPLAWNGENFDYQTLNSYVSFYNVMTYDFSGKWSASADHNASLTDCKNSLDYLINQRGIPPTKINMGIPFYGRMFPYQENIHDSCDDPCGDEAGKCTCATEYNYSEINNMILNDSDWVWEWDATASVPYGKKQNGPGVLTYDNQKSVSEKVKYALNTRSLGGVFVWKLGQDLTFKESNYSKPRESDLGETPLMESATTTYIEHTASVHPKYVCKDGYCNGETECYESISEAFGSVSENISILVDSNTDSEHLSFDKGFQVILRGGFDSDYSNVSPGTTSCYSLEILSGCLTIENFTIGSML